MDPRYAKEGDIVKHDPFRVPPVLVLTLAGPWLEDMRAAILADYNSEEMVAWRAEQRRLAREGKRPAATPAANPRPTVVDRDTTDEEEDDGPPSRERKRGLSHEEALEIVERFGNPKAAERNTGIARSTIRDALSRGKEKRQA